VLSGTPDGRPESNEHTAYVAFLCGNCSLLSPFSPRASVAHTSKLLQPYPCLSLSIAPPANPNMRCAVPNSLRDNARCHTATSPKVNRKLPAAAADADVRVGT
jgi:hypothetical protein